MLEVKIDILPFGDENFRETIKEMIITNNGTHKKRPEYGNYFVLCDGIEFEVKNHKRSDGIWVLLKKIIDKLLEEQNA